MTISDRITLSLTVDDDEKKRRAFERVEDIQRNTHMLILKCELCGQFQAIEYLPISMKILGCSICGYDYFIRALSLVCIKSTNLNVTCKTMQTMIYSKIKQQLKTTSTDQQNNKRPTTCDLFVLRSKNVVIRLK